MKNNVKKALLFVIVGIVLFISIVGVGFYYNMFGLGAKDGEIHFSVDDTIAVFQDLEENKEDYSSIFENPMLNFFEKCHEKYGAKFSLYCYYESEDFNLSMVTNRYRNEFLNNSDWLRFGFHYKNGEEPDEISAETIIAAYQQLTKELLRITGSVDTTIRLSYFKGSYEVVSALKEEGVDCLLTADDDRQSYYFDSKVNTYIDLNDSYYDSSNGMNFVSTDLRLDNIRKIMLYPELIKISMDNNQNKIIAVFTHEWLMDENMYDKIEFMCKFANNYHYNFTMLE